MLELTDILVNIVVLGDHTVCVFNVVGQVFGEHLQVLLEDFNLGNLFAFFLQI